MLRIQPLLGRGGKDRDPAAGHDAAAAHFGQPPAVGALRHGFPKEGLRGRLHLVQNGFILAAHVGKHGPAVMQNVQQIVNRSRADTNLFHSPILTEL
jgi:hypothetical protein